MFRVEVDAVGDWIAFEPGWRCRSSNVRGIAESGLGCFETSDGVRISELVIAEVGDGCSSSCLRLSCQCKSMAVVAAKGGFGSFEGGKMSRAV